MSSWLNFNESLSSLKGQISTFANNVLAEDEGTESTNNVNYEELKKLCVQKELEIEKLRNLNEELQKKENISESQNGETNTNNWDWNAQEPTVVDESSKENLSDLKTLIKDLENEKKDVLNQLEQLDSEHQQNLAEMVAIREKLHCENIDLKEKCNQLKKQNKTVTSREEKLKKELEGLEAKLYNFTQEAPSTDTSKSSEEYEMLVKNNQTLKVELEETKDELCALKITQTTIEKCLEETRLNRDEELSLVLEKLKQNEAAYSVIYSELQKAKEHIKLSEIKSQEDAETCQKLAFILESYEKQVSSLKDELSIVQQAKKTFIPDTNETDNFEIIKQDYKKELDEAQQHINSLENQIAKIKTEVENTQLKTNQTTEELSKRLEEKNTEVATLHKQLQELESQNGEIVSELTNELNDLRREVSATSSEKENMHKMYVNIITENVKRYIDSELPSLQGELTEDPHVFEFSKQVEDIFKILLDFKQKCEKFEREVFEVSQEKAQILNEKNHEIEKLIQNSEVLSQEVITKTETIKELEGEISDLLKSNDMVMSELDSYKNSGLQTISESNEDNMVLLETDLENANKKIKELEDIIEVENKKSSSSLSETTVEVETNQEKINYQELLNSFDDIKIDFETMRDELNDKNSLLDVTVNDNEELRTHLEKIKADFENTEYQLTETNVAIDGLREELEASKLKISVLLKENEIFKLQNKNTIDLKTELNELREKWLTEENLRRELESQVKMLTEKLQNSKMTETSLKLQCDTLNKGNTATLDAKNNLESMLTSAKTSIEIYEKNYTELLQKYDGILLRCEELNTQLHEKENEALKISKTLIELEEQNIELQKIVNDKTIEFEQHLVKNEAVELDSSMAENVFQNKIVKNNEIELVLEEKSKLQEETNSLQATLQQSEQNVSVLQQQLQEITNSRNELINMLTVKHQESLAYHKEIQRLSQILKTETQKCLQLESQLMQASSSSTEMAKKSEEIDKITDKNLFLQEKCEILAKNLLEEQAKLQQLLTEKSGPSEKELSVSKQLERLQSHLMEVEEHYTQELLQAEKKNAELQSTVTDLEKREKNSSTMYTSVSIRSNQQVETLQKQLQMVTNQREELIKKVSDAEDLNNKQSAALANLQFVLEQFQKDKEKDIIKETERIRRKINVEKQVQEDLKKEIFNLKSQLEESKQGLQAASRLSDQLEFLKKHNSGLKDEVSQLLEKLSKSKQTIINLTSQTDGKIDRSLVKNLVVGFLSSGSNGYWNQDQIQVLKIIATVLDFNQQDHDKVKLKTPRQGSWLGSILFPQSSNQNMSQESLSQAFIKFLENESKPRVVPSLLSSSEQTTKPSTSTDNSKKSTPTASPIVLNEIVLPTFADFSASRNSSSILKDVLKDNS